MRLKITVKKLKKCECSDLVIEMFLKKYPDGVMIVKWSKKTQIELLKTSPLKMFFGLAINKGIVPAYSMRNADLRNANLRNADLTGAKFNYNGVVYIIK